MVLDVVVLIRQLWFQTREVNFVARDAQRRQARGANALPDTPALRAKSAMKDILDSLIARPGKNVQRCAPMVLYVTI